MPQTMKENPPPQGIEERCEDMRSRVHQAMAANPDPEIRSYWSTTITNAEDPNRTLSIAAIVADSIALTLAPRTRTELGNHTRTFLNEQKEVIEKQKLTQDPHKYPLAEKAIATLTSLLNTPTSRRDPEKADLGFRTDIASAAAQLQLVTNSQFVDTIYLPNTQDPKKFSELGISFADRLRAVGHMTTVAMNTTLRLMKEERGLVAKK